MTTEKEALTVRQVQLWPKRVETYLHLLCPSSGSVTTVARGTPGSPHVS